MKDYSLERRKTHKIFVGDVQIGGNAPISVQSMTNTDTHNYDATYRQIRALEEVGCDIVRITVPDLAACETIARLKKSNIRIPLVADIHFDYRIALSVADAGVDKIRINPGNIGSDEKVKAVAEKCKERHIPIRIGINSGSLEKSILAKYGSPTPQALAESAMYHAALLEKFDFGDIAISIKSSDVRNMIEANRIVAASCDYPLHIGVTEAGRGNAGTIKSAIGIGTLLCEGIGDTIRVSLTDDPVKEIEAGRSILRACGRSEEKFINLVSCPTCGRTKIDLIRICEELERRLSSVRVDRKLTVAVMGCVVNGPGEAAEADIGIAGGKGEGILFSHGTILRRIPEEKLVDELIEEIKNRS
ncbi:MAG: flavodoxin-dependent (E)-4-hydroxy-3-methylbut-2-enyl-diphosphate synthase [Clostridia bacterium]|nr:flavodoxin-dependent (E)-4-hydroxy-3-methylbut-2-enyl-diphosphate synthase [Clostridia bacterium]